MREVAHETSNGNVSSRPASMPNLFNYDANQEWHSLTVQKFLVFFLLHEHWSSRWKFYSLLKHWHISPIYINDHEMKVFNVVIWYSRYDFMGLHCKFSDMCEKSERNKLRCWYPSPLLADLERRTRESPPDPRPQKKLAKTRYRIREHVWGI